MKLEKIPPLGFSEFVKESQVIGMRGNKLKKVTVRKIWESWGEGSSSFSNTDEWLELVDLAQAVVDSEGDTASIKELEDYCRTCNLEVYGNWQNNWPTGFLGSKAKGCITWDKEKMSVLEFANWVLNCEYLDTDTAIEEVAIDFVNGTVDEKAKYLLGNDALDDSGDY